MLSRFPYPLEKGDKLRAYFQLRDLSEHYRIALFCTNEKEVGAAHFDEVSKFCESIHILRLRKAGMLFAALYAVITGKPFQVAYFYRLRHQRTVNRMLEKLRPDHIYCQLIRSSEYVKHYHLCPKTLDYMDALSKGMERRIATEPSYRRWFYKTEFRRLADYERRIFDYFENKTIISSQDRQLILHPDRHSISIIPNGVSAHFFEKLTREKDYELLFTGNMSYPPNVAAAEYLAAEILPQLHARGHKLRLLLSGADPSPKIRALASEYVHVTGWVDDIRESYARSKIFVAPMFLGTGLQNKLLEAMAAGVPCITTKLANNALGATDNENILLAENSAAFVEKIIIILTDQSKFHEILNSAHDFVLNNYSWKHQNDLLIQSIRSGY
jgi:polysaccharide biosynthesis protein PslH